MLHAQTPQHFLPNHETCFPWVCFYLHLPWPCLWAPRFHIMCMFCIFKPVQGWPTAGMFCHWCLLAFSPSHALSCKHTVLDSEPITRFVFPQYLIRQLWKHWPEANARGHALTPQTWCWWCCQFGPPPWRGGALFLFPVGIQRESSLPQFLWMR